jgi:hypothetical protein
MARPVSTVHKRIYIKGERVKCTTQMCTVPRGYESSDGLNMCRSSVTKVCVCLCVVCCCAVACLAAAWLVEWIACLLVESGEDQPLMDLPHIQTCDRYGFENAPRAAVFFPARSPKARKPERPKDQRSKLLKPPTHTHTHTQHVHGHTRLNPKLQHTNHHTINLLSLSKPTSKPTNHTNPTTSSHVSHRVLCVQAEQLLTVHANPSSAAACGSAHTSPLNQKCSSSRKQRTQAKQTFGSQQQLALDFE